MARYCMPEGTCYCGKCPHYKPMPASSVPTVKPKTNKRQAKSWATREEPTWIDKD